jgi:hypothetical protein
VAQLTTDVINNIDYYASQLADIISLNNLNNLKLSSSSGGVLTVYAPLAGVSSRVIPMTK